MNINGRESDKKKNGPGIWLHYTSLSLLRLYIIYAKLNLLQFLLSEADPLSYLFIDLSSKALL